MHGTQNVMFHPKSAHIQAIEINEVTVKIAA